MTDAIQKAREALKAARESFRTGRGQLSASNMILDALAALDAETDVERGWQIKSEVDGWTDFASADEVIAEVRERGFGFVKYNPPTEQRS